jgi:hypothetical protein
MFESARLRHIVIPDGIQVVSERAFFNCEYLVSVTFVGSSLKVIEAEAFSGCVMPSITFPTSLTRIGPFAFRNCPFLRQVEFSGSKPRIEDETFTTDPDLSKWVHW